MSDNELDDDAWYEAHLERYNAWLDAVGGTDFDGDDETREWFDAGLSVALGKEKLLRRWIEGLSSCLPSDDDLQFMGGNDTVTGTALTAMQARLLRHLLRKEAPDGNS